jgi:hypothetical protein
LEWDTLLDVRLIADRTDVVGEFIYFPLVVLFFLLLARISYFADWDWKPGVIVVYALGTVYAICSALVLRMSAENARCRALSTLKKQLLLLIVAPTPARQGARQPKENALKQVIAEVEGERRGAFSILSQYPLLAAILLPSGGLGIWAAIEYLSTRAFF